MPKLDEGALWVRATLPYSISFEESSRIVPQVRDIIRGFPEVTVVDLRARAAPTMPPIRPGSSMRSSMSASSRTASGSGAMRNKAQLIAAIDARLQRFPGITFNYTQPAEDAVDEAETGLKSSLDVKVFGADLGVLEAKGREVKKVLDSIPGFRTSRSCRNSASPAS